MRPGIAFLDHALTPAERVRRAGRTLRAAAGLAPRDGATVVLAAGLLAWYRLRIAVAGGGHRLLAREMGEERDAGRVAGGGDPEAAHHLARLFHDAAARPPVGGSCIPRSLALARLLRLHGLPARVRVGLRRTGGGLAGHAWVEHHGTLIGDRHERVRELAPLSVGRSGRPPEAE